MKTQAKDAVALAMDWLAQLRDEDSPGPRPGDGQSATESAPPAGDFGDLPPAAPPAGDFGDAAPAAPPPGELGDAVPAVPPAASWDATPSAVDWGDAHPAAPPSADWGDAAPGAPPAADSWWTAAPPASDSGSSAVPPGTTSSGRDGTATAVEITERAVIGDELRIPLAWCEMGACISRYADPAALGEADIRARAIAAGWRADALGRLACPQCQQSDSWFWTAHPAALWDRDTAVAMTTLMAAALREIAGADGTAGVEPGAPLGGEPGAFPGGEPGVVPGPRPEVARPPGRGRHRGHPGHADPAQ
jgi:hypothetical protein